MHRRSVNIAKNQSCLHDRSAVICASLPPLTILLIDMHVSLLEQTKCMWPNPRTLVDTKLFRSTHETRNSTTFHSVSASPSRFSVLLIPTLNPQYPSSIRSKQRVSRPPTPLNSTNAASHSSGYQTPVPRGWRESHPCSFVCGTTA